MPYLAAAVQLSSTESLADSMAQAEAGVRAAAARGAQLIALPEALSFQGDEEKKAAHAEPIDGPSFGRLSALAAELSVHLLGGGIPERPAEGGRPYNTAVLYGPSGARLAAYRKLHLFDNARAQESKQVQAGDALSAAETPLGRIGLSVCYDLRFSELYLALRRMGAELLFIPAAFTMKTGEHWLTLLKARAIETQCYVIAPAQSGLHNDAGLRSYGHSAIIDPWGRVLCEAADRPSPQVICAEIDLAYVAQLRTRSPSFGHRRPELYDLSSH